MRFDGQRVGVAGLGVSGRAAAAALAPLGAELALYDAAPAARGIFSAAGDAGVAASGGWGGWTPDQAKAVAAAANGVVLDPAAPAVPPADLDLLVVSPGWAPDAPLLAGARAAGVPIWSEVELAWRLRANPDAPWLAVTGTNGKTTAVGMLEAILLASGRRARAAGNVGAPLVTAVQDPEVEVFAVELSSFQLHHTHSMRAQAAAILNIAPDHLDWHGSLEAYAAAKGKIYAGARSAAVYNAADPLAKELAARAGAPPVGFTLGAPRLGEVGVIESRLADRAFHGRRRRHALDIASLEDVARPWGGRLPPHLAANALAATALALAYGAGADGIGQGLRSFTPGAHRGEVVGEAGGVRFADDSKATNAHAAAAALAGFAPASVVWIAGGLAKGARFEDLVARRADRLRAAVLIGVDPGPLAEALAQEAPGVPVERIADGPDVMGRAVRAAAALARPGGTVLLAPAGASMDQFASYADRGDAFRRAVIALGSKAGGGEE